MEPSTLLHADYLDILFDRRNKEYGGYELRRHYNQRMGKAALLMLLVICSFALLSFINSRNAGIIYRHYSTPVTPTYIDPPKILPKVLPPAPPPPSRHSATNVFVVPKIVPNKDMPPDKQLTENIHLGNTHPGLTNTTGDTTGLGSSGIGGKGAIAVTVVPPPKPLTWVAQMPEFPGDMKAYISGHIQYPDAARSANIQGPVVVRFVVNEDGSVSDAEIIRGIGGGCDEEALRMVGSMPKWKPGRQNGVPVKVFFTLPVRFELD